MAADEAPRREVPLYALLALYIAALTANVYLFWVLPSGSTLERLSFSLQLIGLYSLALNFLAATNLFKTFPMWLEEMTSADLRKFAGAVFQALGVTGLLASLLVRGFPPPLITERLPLLLQVLVVVTLGLLFAVLNVVVFAVMVVVFLIGIAPIAYIGYAVASVLVASILAADRDIEVQSGEASLSLKTAVDTHAAELRTLLVGLPATALGLATAGYALFT